MDTIKAPTPAEIEARKILQNIQFSDLTKADWGVEDSQYSGRAFTLLYRTQHERELADAVWNLLATSLSKTLYCLKGNDNNGKSIASPAGAIILFDPYEDVDVSPEKQKGLIVCLTKPLLDSIQNKLRGKERAA